MNLRIKLISLLVIATAFGGCNIQKKDTGTDTVALPEQALEQFNVTETKGGQPHWVLDADSAQILDSEKKAILQAPKIKFFKDGKQISYLVADKGRINTETYDIWGDGKCILTTEEGERLETSNLQYRSGTQTIVTEEKVKLIRPGEVITGKGMEATPDLQNITIKKQRVVLKDK